MPERLKLRRARRLEGAFLPSSTAWVRIYGNSDNSDVLLAVPDQSQDELDLKAYHRVRSRLVSRRTATVNQIRAFLIEQGIAVRPGLRALRVLLFEILKNRADEIKGLR